MGSDRPEHGGSNLPAPGPPYSRRSAVRWAAASPAEGSVEADLRPTAMHTAKTYRPHRTSRDHPRCSRPPLPAARTARRGATRQTDTPRVARFLHPPPRRHLPPGSTPTPRRHRHHHPRPSGQQARRKQDRPLPRSAPPPRRIHPHPPPAPRPGQARRARQRGAQSAHRPLATGHWHSLKPAEQPTHACTQCTLHHTQGSTSQAWAYHPEHQRLCMRHRHCSTPPADRAPLNTRALPELAQAHHAHQRLARRSETPIAYQWASMITTRWYDREQHLTRRWHNRLARLARTNPPPERGKSWTLTRPRPGHLPRDRRPRPTPRPRTPPPGQPRLPRPNREHPRPQPARTPARRPPLDLDPHPHQAATPRTPLPIDRPLHLHKNPGQTGTGGHRRH